MFQPQTNEVHVSVQDLITVAPDGSVAISRSFLFVTDSDAEVAFRYTRAESFGIDSEPLGEVPDSSLARLRLYTAEQGSERFTWDVQARVRAETPLTVRLHGSLLPPSSASPLRYEVYFQPWHRIAYQLRVIPPYPQVTEPSRTLVEMLAPHPPETIQRTDAGELIHMFPSLSANKAGHVRVRFTHGQELRSTLLMRHYAERFGT